MPEYTKRGRVLLQDTGSNDGTWGEEDAVGTSTRQDEMWGTAEVVVNAPVTLTALEGFSDEARSVTIICTGAGGHPVSTPSAVDKPYLVINNCADDITFGPTGGTKATVRAGRRAVVTMNAAGTVAYAFDPSLDQIKPPAAAVDMDGEKLINLGAPTNPGDAVTKNYLDTLAASSDLGTVAAIASEVVIVAGIAAQVVIAANIADEVVIVAGIADDVTQLAGMFIGARTTDPTTRLDGSPLQAGDYYLNTSGTPTVRIYSGSAWIPISTVTIASQAQAQAGTNNTAVMTPLRSREAIASFVRFTVDATYTASTTFTKDADDYLYFVEAIGGGGSGNVQSTTANRAGGGGGGYNSRYILASDVANGTAITIGAGGAAVTGAGSAVSGNNGGDTSFGTHVTARGGQGGTGSVASGSAAGSGEIGGAPGNGGYSSGGGGVAGGGVGGSCVKGGAGGGGTGAGGISLNGGNGGAAVASGTPNNGQAPGGGGGNQSSLTGTSGAGARGELRITRFKR